MIGDITGFLAAIYMRGIPFVQVPTTLLAQVDSSVGGKTGVNLAAGKNLVGSFNHPRAVLVDIDLLRTLPPAELRAGLQESIKAGIIRSPALFRLLEKSVPHSSRPHRDEWDPATLQKIIAASIRVKAEVVTLDERESQGGPRMTLNFGHTLGHAIEAATGYKKLLHGEAVAWGSIAALHLSLARGLISQEDFARMANLILACGPLPRFTANPEKLVALTWSDKKTRSGKRAYVLSTGIGTTQIAFDVTDAELLTAAQVHAHRHANVNQHFNNSSMIPTQPPTISTGLDNAPGAPSQSASSIEVGAPAIASGAIQPADSVRDMFDAIAGRYDLLNHILSAGIDRLWWRRAARAVAPILRRPEAQILDLCCGTGDMTLALLAHRPPSANAISQVANANPSTPSTAPILAVDFSHQMLSLGNLKYIGKNVLPIEADALHLPLPPNALDLISSAFGFRNLADYEAGLAELFRVLRPGGQIAILDCNQPEGLLGSMYNLHLHRILPAIGSLLSNPDAYKYLPASIARFPPTANAGADPRRRLPLRHVD